MFLHEKNEAREKQLKTILEGSGMMKERDVAMPPIQTRTLYTRSFILLANSKAALTTARQAVHGFRSCI